MAERAPEETDILCENCGYILNGLGSSGNCPECGTPIDLSLSPHYRVPPLWEADDRHRPKWLRWLLTSLEVLLHPRRFFRGLNSRGELAPAQQFARIHWRLAAVILGTTAFVHAGNDQGYYSRLPVYAMPIFWIGAYLLIRFTVDVAARLTAWEAAYRGFRLPQPVVLRALAYHAVHLLPSSALALAFVSAYAIDQSWPVVKTFTELVYTYSLCGLVIVSAGYLFGTYWIAMRNLFYANR